MYIAASKHYEEHDIDSLHTYAYNTLHHTVTKSRYKKLITGNYRQAIYTDSSAFKEILPFFLIRPLYTTTVYLLYQAGIDIALATHCVSGIAITLALMLLYLLSCTLLHHPYAYLIPLLALVLKIETLAQYSTPDGMALLAIVLAAYFFLQNKIPILLFFLPIMIGIRTDLILFSSPLLFLIALSGPQYRIMCAVSALMSVLGYLAINSLSGHPGWSTIFYFTLIEKSTHPLSIPLSLSAHHYFYALTEGIKRIPENFNFLFFIVISLLFLGVMIYRAATTSLLSILRTPTVSLYLVCCFFVFSHFVLFPVSWDRFFIGPYLISAFLLLTVMAENCTSINTFLCAAAEKNYRSTGN